MMIKMDTCNDHTHVGDNHSKMLGDDAQNDENDFEEAIAGREGG